jgi:PemK-like, MazF-like toxin of type II toxin-antitoxin system
VRDVDPRAPVRILYAPEIDGDPDPGEVVWGWVPFEDDPMQGKDRPVVIVGRRGDLLAAVPLTSRPDGRDGRVAVGPGPWDRQARPSYARVDRVVDLDPADVRREGAILPRDRFDAVVAEVVRRHRTEGGGQHRVP